MEREKLETLSLEALRMLAQERGVDGTEGLGRAQLIALLVVSEKPSPSEEEPPAEEAKAETEAPAEEVKAEEPAAEEVKAKEEPARPAPPPPPPPGEPYKLLD